MSLRERCMTAFRPCLFPLGVTCFYGMGWLLAPEKALRAMEISISMFRQLALPMCFAVVMMVAVNRVFSPAMVSRFLGNRAGFRGILLSSLAGVLSMGPIYAWYPLFKTLKESGASSLVVANFISCRSVKPVLFPVLLAYFGWLFSLLFVLLSLVGAFVVAFIVHSACPDWCEDADSK